MRCPCGKTFVEEDATQCWLCGVAIGAAAPPAADRPPRMGPATPPGMALPPPPPPSAGAPRRGRGGLVAVLVVVGLVVLSGIGFVGWKVVGLGREVTEGNEAVERYVDGKRGVEFESQTCRFRATFPTEPKEKSESSTVEGQQLTAAEYRSPPAATTTHVLAACAWALGVAFPTDFVQTFIDLAAAGGTAEIISSEPTELQGFAAAEVVARINRETSRAIVAVVGDRLLMFVVGGRDDSDADAAFERFVDSVELFDTPE